MWVSFSQIRLSSITHACAIAHEKNVKKTHETSHSKLILMSFESNAIMHDQPFRTIVSISKVSKVNVY